MFSKIFRAMKQNGSAKPGFQTDKYPTFLAAGFPFIQEAKMGSTMLNREPKMDPLKQTGWNHALADQSPSSLAY